MLISWALLGSTLLGAVAGIVVGVLPGVGPLTAFALLSAWLFVLPIDQALAVVMGIYFGAQYGGAIPAIMLGVPGETSALPSCVTGRQLASRGLAKTALRIAAWSSLAGGLVSLGAIAFLTRPLAELALKLGPADIAGLFLFGLAVTWFMGSAKSSLGAACLVGIGWLLGTVGVDPATGIPRGTFGIPELMDGIGVGLLGIGLFGFGCLPWVGREFGSASRNDDRAMDVSAPTDIGAVGRGSLLGTAMGLIPGGGAVLGATSAFYLEKRIGGAGMPKARNLLASPEAANNAGAQAGMVPLLALGLPTNPALAVMASLLVVKGVTPGPGLMRDMPELLGAIQASMLIGNLLMAATMIANAGMWARLAELRPAMLRVLIGGVGLAGAYFSNESWVDVALALGIGVIGIGLHWRKLDPVPVFMGFVLGPLCEEYLRRAEQVHADAISVLMQPGLLLALVLTAGLVATRLSQRAPADVLVSKPSLEVI